MKIGLRPYRLIIAAQAPLLALQACFPPANKKARRSLIYGLFSLEAEVGIEPAWADLQSK
ncbi:hypothetical protein C6Q18_16670 [Pseudomonas chlororaphis subsp. piscium]|nr:hypothetical protein C6Q18_16670 [Pseudomonas chlororaphis subsp. piscium]